VEQEQQEVPEAEQLLQVVLGALPEEVAVE